MAHYAFLDDNNIVTEIIVGKDETDITHDWEVVYSEVRNQPCKRTSINTIGGQHVAGGTPFRKNFAGIGYTYDETHDAFIPPQPFPSWTLNEVTCLWDSPIPYPDDGQKYAWHEETRTWVVSPSDGEHQ